MINKFRAQRTNGFSSKLESAVYDILLAKQNIGLIGDLKCQQTVVLQDGPREVRITWRLDFSFIDFEIRELAYAESKGIETCEYKLKLKLWRKNPPARLYIYKGSYQNPKLVEIVK